MCCLVPSHRQCFLLNPVRFLGLIPIGQPIHMRCFLQKNIQLTIPASKSAVKDAFELKPARNVIRTPCHLKDV